MSKLFAALLIMLENVLHNNFDSPTKLVLDPYLAKFLDISTKSFFLFVLIYLDSLNKLIVIRKRGRGRERKRERGKKDKELRAL